MKNIYALILAVVTVSFAAAQQEQEVTIDNGEIKLSGTLSYPTGGDKFPAIILISGSGAQNRDSDILGFKPFKILADHFNSKGIAVLRYDDRGTGKSTGKSVGQSTSEEIATDAEAAFNFLKNHKKIDAKQIGLLGHSEGGVIAPMVAARESEVAFVILMAGYGVPGVELTNAQQAAILKSGGMSDEYIEKASQMNQQLITAMVDENKTVEDVKQLASELIRKQIQYLPENVKSQIADEDAYVQMQVQSVVAQMQSPWIKYYMQYDPAPTLTKVSCPVLVLFGELDTQVTEKQNKEVMANALENNKNVTIKTFEKANHLFQEAKTGSPMEYASLKKEFVEGFESYISDWVLEEGVSR